MIITMAYKAIWKLSNPNIYVKCFQRWIDTIFSATVGSITNFLKVSKFEKRRSGMLRILAASIRFLWMTLIAFVLLCQKRRYTSYNVYPRQP
jgi:hypothetical protein